MTDLAFRELMDTEIRRMMIPADNVACVQEDNSAEHALLILIKAGYSAIPVLNAASKVVGMISKTLILDGILGLERIEFEKLESSTVAQMMNRDVPRVQANKTFIRALELSINAPFVCVEDESGTFMGLLTRRAVLALVYQYLRGRNGIHGHS